MVGDRASKGGVMVYRSSWRKHENHRQETQAVKKALQAVGINAIVGHGKGTARSWLEINIGECQQWGNHTGEKPGRCPVPCLRCNVSRQLRGYTLKIAKDTTGRDGEYDGNILILTQDRWDDNAGHIPIVHNRATVDRFLAIVST